VHVPKVSKLTFEDGKFAVESTFWTGESNLESHTQVEHWSGPLSSCFSRLATLSLEESLVQAKIRYKTLAEEKAKLEQQKIAKEKLEQAKQAEQAKKNQQIWRAELERSPMGKTWNALGLRLGMSQGQVKAIVTAKGFKSPNEKIPGPWYCSPGWNSTHTMYGTDCLTFSPTGTRLMMEFILAQRSVNPDTGMVTDIPVDKLSVAKFGLNDEGNWAFSLH